MSRKLKAKPKSTPSHRPRKPPAVETAEAAVDFQIVPASPVEIAPQEAATAPRVCLDLACGQSCREGFEGVDVWEGAKHQVDLFRFPWPWADGVVDELNCSHFVEHLPMEFVGERHRAEIIGAGSPTPHLGKDLLLAFMDECWRVLKKTKDPNQPAGVINIYCPNARSNRGFQDPTHRRFIVGETFLYFNRDWRVAQKLDHYPVECHFALDVRPLIPNEIGLLHPEAQQRRMNENWNTVLDWHARLIAVE